MQYCSTKFRQEATDFPAGLESAQPLKKSRLTISKRSDPPDDRYRTAPQRALFDTQKIHKGGFYHNGRFGTLSDVVNHYDRTGFLARRQTKNSYEPADDFPALIEKAAPPVFEAQCIRFLGGAPTH